MDFYKTHLPYCLKKQDNGAYVVLNRRYKPIGFDPTVSHSVNYSEYPILIEINGLSEEMAGKLSHDGSRTLDDIYLYDDSCVPVSSDKSAKAYFDKLAILAKLSVDVLPPKTSQFYQWLVAQAQRNDPIGELAVDVRRDSCFPANGDREAVRSYLSGKDSSVFEVFENAWQEFEQS